MTNTSSLFTTRTASGRAVETDLRRALIALQVVMAELDPAAIPLPDATAVFTLFADVRRLAGNGQTLMAGRVKEAREWARSGHTTVEDWIANTTGSSVGAAKDQVRTSERLDQLPDTTEQMRTGGVSPEQADIVADAAAVNPASERDLLDRARRDSNKALRDEAARRKAQARGETANEKAQRHHAERSARFYNDRDGRRCLYAQGTAADLAALEAAIDRSVDRRYRSTGPTGRRAGVGIATRSTRSPPWPTVAPVIQAGATQAPRPHSGRPVPRWCGARSTRARSARSPASAPFPSTRPGTCWAIRSCTSSPRTVSMSRTSRTSAGAPTLCNRSPSCGAPDSAP
ncbi:MAG: hypothetical protein V9G12_08035 [Microthrixaceae bacterium]